MQSIRRQASFGPRRNFMPPDMKSESRKTASAFNYSVVTTAAILALLGALLAFGLIGASIARGFVSFRDYAWIPRLLSVASGFLLATTLLRLIRRLLFHSPRR
jgi:zinc transporter ZupT